jgi:hypothetical protein
MDHNLFASALKPENKDAGRDAAGVGGQNIGIGS